MVTLGMMALDDVLGGVMGLARVITCCEGGAGVSRGCQRQADASMKVQFRLAIVLQLIAWLLRQLERQLRNAVGICVVEDADRLLSDRVAMLLVESLRPHVRSRTVRRSIRSVLLATQDFGLLLGHEWASSRCLLLLRLLHVGYVVLLLLELCKLLLILGDVGAAH